MPRTPRRPSAAVTMQMVAKQAGVSQMTVSNVIHGYNVKPALRERVLAAISDLKYSPNTAAQALASVSVPCIGLPHSPVASEYLSAVTIGALEATSRLGVPLLVERIEGFTAQAAFDAIDVLINRGANALLLPAPVCERVNLDPRRKAYVIPMMGLSPSGELDGMSSIRVDDFAAARDMTRLLLSMGHTRVAFIEAPSWQMVHHSRRDGYTEALREAGLAVDERLIVAGGSEFEAHRTAAHALLDGAEPPTAIFASSDGLAAGVIAVAHERGLKIPGDLIVAGFDDSPLATKVWPPLSSVRQPLGEMASLAVERLAAAVRARDDASEPATTYLPYEIVQRASTGH